MSPLDPVQHIMSPLDPVQHRVTSCPHWILSNTDGWIMLMVEPESTSAIIGIPFASIFILRYKLPWQSLFKIISCSNDPLTKSAAESRFPDAAEFTELGTRHSRSRRRACTSSFQVKPRIIVDEVAPRLRTLPYPMSECSAVETGPSVFFRTDTSPVSGFSTDSAQTRPMRIWFCYWWPRSGIYILVTLVKAEASIKFGHTTSQSWWAMGWISLRGSFHIPYLDVGWGDLGFSILASQPCPPGHGIRELRTTFLITELFNYWVLEDILKMHLIS